MSSETPQPAPERPGRPRYRDRRAAGRALACEVARLEPVRPVVLALPRGGVPVAFEVASRLRAPLDVLVVRKVGAPGNPELAIGAVAEGGVSLLNRAALERLRTPPEELERRLAQARAQLRARVAAYRHGVRSLALAGRQAIIVDDGFATGSSARAAAEAVRARAAACAVLAAPVGALATVDALAAAADAVVCLWQPAELWSVGSWYERFEPVPDDEVAALLRRAYERSASG